MSSTSTCGSQIAAGVQRRSGRRRGLVRKSAGGRELAVAITDVDQLTAASSNGHRRLWPDTPRLRHRGPPWATAPSIDRRSRGDRQPASQRRRRAGKPWTSGSRSRSCPTGLRRQTDLSPRIGRLRYGVRIDGVNIMTMDYGDNAAAPNRADRWASTPSRLPTASSSQLNRSTARLGPMPNSEHGRADPDDRPE